jgi:hypothetical protein
VILLNDNYTELTNRIVLGIGGPVVAFTAVFDPAFAIVGAAGVLAGPAFDHYQSTHGSDDASDELEERGRVDREGGFDLEDPADA